MLLKSIPRNLMILLLSVPLFLVAFWPEWVDYFSLWYHSIIYTHGFLVVAGILFLLYRRKSELSRLAATGSWLGLLALLGLAAIMLFAKAADIKTVRLVFLPLIIIAWGWTIWGRAFLRVAAPSILLLLFAAPIWDDFSFILQYITVAVDELLLSLFSIPAEIDEFYIAIPSGVFHVAGGCSGVRYLMVGLFLAAFQALLAHYNIWRAAALIAIAGFLSMLANWIRVFGIIFWGHHTEMQTSLIKDHEAFGWVVFLIVTLIPFFYIARKLEPQQQTPADDAGATTTPPPSRFKWSWPILASALVLTVPAILNTQEAAMIERGNAWNPALPAVNNGWEGPLQFADIWEPRFKNPDVEVSGVYVSPNLERVQLQLVAYRHQTQAKELIYYQNELFDERQWAQVTVTPRNISETGNLAPSRVKETILRDKQNGGEIILWSWYDLGGYQDISNLKVKLVGGLNKLVGDGRAALWALAGQCEGDGETRCDNQRQVFGRFLSSLEAEPVISDSGASR